MLKILSHEDEYLVSLQGDDLDMNYSQEIFKWTKESRKAAKNRYNELFVSKGTDEEYFKTLTEELADSELLRRRANFVTDRPHS